MIPINPDHNIITAFNKIVVVVVVVGDSNLYKQ